MSKKARTSFRVDVELVLDGDVYQMLTTVRGVDLQERLGDIEEELYRSVESQDEAEVELDETKIKRPTKDG